MALGQVAPSSAFLLSQIIPQPCFLLSAIPPAGGAPQEAVVPQTEHHSIPRIKTYTCSDTGSFSICTEFCDLCKLSVVNTVKHIELNVFHPEVLSKVILG